MIVPMKKVSLVVTGRAKDALLKDLQNSGILEIIEQAEKIDKALEEKIELYYKIRRTVADLKREKKNRKYINFPQISGNALEILHEYDLLHERIASVTRDLEKLEMEEMKVRPWGNFHMEEIEKLREFGVDAHFFIMPIKKFKSLELENIAYEIIRRDKKFVYLVIFSREKLSLAATEIFPPLESLEVLALKIMQAVKDREEIEKKMIEYTQYIDMLADYAVNLKNSIAFDKANLHCNEDESGRMVFINAWFPAKSESKLVPILESHPLYFEIEDPVPGENPPVLLKNNIFIKPFEAITRIFSLPSYFEMDPTPLIAPFYALFFGLCVADVGYAVLLIAGLAIYYFKANENLKPVLKLGIFLGISTLAAGYWSNSFFGFSIFENRGISGAILKVDSSGDFLASYVEEGKMVFPAMTFSLFLGYIQVSFGIILQFINKWRVAGVKYSLQTLSYLMFINGAAIYGVHKDILGMASMKIGELPLGQYILYIPAQVGNYILLIGCVLLLFFNNPDKKIWVRPPLALWDFYGFASGLMGDILSYLRLFALGLAGGLLGGAFNNIAFSIMDGSGIIGIAFGVLIMILGHSLNLILSLLGAFVHSLRLTFVEFYKNLSFQGGGKPFTPFSMEK